MDEMKKRVLLTERAKDVQKEFEKATEHLNTVQTSLEKLVGDNRRGRIIGSMVLTGVWALAAAAVYWAGTYYLGGSWGLPMLISTLLLAVLMIVSQFLRLSHYRTMLDDLDETMQIREHLSVHSAAAETRYQAMERGVEQGWDVPLNVPMSVPGEVDRIAQQLSDMQSFDDGRMQRVLAGVLFLATALWTVFAADILRYITAGVAFLNVSAHTSTVLFYVVLGVSAAIAVGAAVFIWTKTHFRVNNLTLFSLLVGPAVFEILSMLVRYALFLLVIAVVVGFVLLYRRGQNR